ncbi:MAG TPA: AgmX/PglI C-terminal domain-containing protein [Gemmatimonadaceae bacterium]|nr:AgmX/PglI C-terminal domain-containing protein [Gemmatimonadaceae bacterium]
MLTALYTVAFSLLLPAQALDAAGTDSLRAGGEVRAAVLRNAKDVRRCYEKEGLRRNPELSGTVELSLTILPTGMVSQAKVDSLELRGPGIGEVARCITRHARTWRFERGPYATEVHLFPLDLVPTQARPAAAAAVRGT